MDVKAQVVEVKALVTESLTEVDQALVVGAVESHEGMVLKMSLGELLEVLSDPRVEFFATESEWDQVLANARVLRDVSRTADDGGMPGRAWPSASTMIAILRNRRIGSIRTQDLGLSNLLSELEPARRQVQSLRARTQSTEESASRLSTRFDEMASSVERFQAEWNARFIESQTKTAEDVSQRREKEREQFEAALSALQLRLDDRDAAALQSIERIAAHEKSAAEASGAVGATAHAAGFEGTAAIAAAVATRWQLGAVSLMAGTAVLLGLLLIFAEPFQFDAGHIAAAVTKVALVTFLGLLSRYCSAMADRSRREHLWAKQRGLEFRALNAYLEGFEAAKRSEMRERLIEKYFGVGSTMLAEVSNQEPPATATIDAALDVLKMFASKVPEEAIPALVESLSGRKAKKAKNEK